MHPQTATTVCNTSEKPELVNVARSLLHVSGHASVCASVYARAPQQQQRQRQPSAARICPCGNRQTDLAMMADCVGFQAQIASIIEILANSAVAEICKLVDDGYAALRSQMDQEREKSEKENDALRQKVREMDVKMRSYERKMRRRSQREEMHAVHFRPPEGNQMEMAGGRAAARLLRGRKHGTLRQPCIQHAY